MGVLVRMNEQGDRIHLSLEAGCRHVDADHQGSSDLVNHQRLSTLAQSNAVSFAELWLRHGGADYHAMCVQDVLDRSRADHDM